MSEGHPGFLGLYNGMASVPAQVKGLVEGADLVLDLGGIVLADTNTAIWTDALPAHSLISVHDSWVQIGDQIFSQVAIDDLLDGLIAQTNRAGPGLPIPVPGAISLSQVGSAVLNEAVASRSPHLRLH